MFRLRQCDTNTWRKTFAEFVQDRHFFSSVIALHRAWLSINILLYTTMDNMIYKEKYVMKLSK